MYFTELAESFAALSLPEYRGKQVFSWLQEKGVSSYGEMSNLPQALRGELAERFPIYHCEILKRQISQRDETVKYLFALHNGTGYSNNEECVESVFLRYRYGDTLCVSTQIGCKMGCAFCASAKGGFVRNLRASEMLGQIHAAQRDRNTRISHVVLMGMGEPLDNFDNVLRFVRLVTAPGGLHIGMRNLSLSTCGIVPRIYDLLEQHLPLTLSVSLHAPEEALRSRLMPINRRYPLSELIPACRQYAQTTSRRISFEYAMIDGLNDSPAQALELAKRIRGILCHVNLIPVNPIEQSPYQPSPAKRIEVFRQTLEQHGTPCTVRRTLGSDLDASCGQLRRQVSGDS